MILQSMSIVQKSMHRFCQTHLFGKIKAEKGASKPQLKRAKQFPDAAKAEVMLRETTKLPKLAMAKESLKSFSSNDE